MTVSHKISPRKISELVKEFAPLDLLQKKQRYLPIYLEGLSPDGTKNSDAVNEFNDLAFIWDLEKLELLGAWKCTTESGWTYRRRQLNNQGFALICFGYQECWRIGAHVTSSTNQYPALVQDAGAVKVIRNRNPQGNRKTGVLHEGYFGINVHTVAVNDGNKTLQSHEMRNTVDGWSAGCLVLQNAEEFYNEFMPIIMKNERRLIGQLILAGEEYVSIDS